MPAMVDDPAAPVIFRTSGDAAYPQPSSPLPVGIAPTQVTLRDRVTTATILPFSAPNQVPLTLLAYLCDQLGREIEKGDTYPMVEPLPLDNFGSYWFGVFGAIVLLSDVQDGRELHEMARRGCDWERECLGSFYIKPNYPGRSSHVCNGGFLVTDASRNRGVGRLMGETYLDWAPKLVCMSESAIGSCLLTRAGLHLLRLQPCLRNQPRIVSDMGCAGLQAHRARQGLRQPQVISRRTCRCHHIRARPRPRRRLCV
jgi:hypothetical protein